jgi:hypothetical protein
MNPVFRSPVTGSPDAGIDLRLDHRGLVVRYPSDPDDVTT